MKRLHMALRASLLAALSRLLPEHARLATATGRALQGADRLLEAERAYERGTRLDPGLFEAHLALGTLRSSMGRLEEARVAFL